jgi:hypothetical protein
MKILRDHPGIVRVVLHEDVRALQTTWVTFHERRDLLRPILDYQLATTSLYQLRFSIVDTSETTGVLDEEQQAWLENDFFPRAAKTGVRALLSVVAKSAVTSLVNKRWQVVATRFGYDVVQVASVPDALEYCRKRLS